ncbi:MAG: fumarylacetoacetate hydrolase family protein [Tateyamaria sp.]|jgi:2-keto-4-pentenoate hydratase/2-oxohepta-3-ene-1,7-dioic acid hydratase in catechol pathway|nr:fumarylacetoacetate hydrolase family protein [Tateyamaria sp.]MBT5302319.1 fumarylacetoacetate hydrolase family protein [Tateyamaria sp.]MBT6266418.1 fumarylacetoacetate hydrolase family protein [Tateyamaria sp.]MBT6343871.1 fumarylacetoacetate hydrolase family protein [Tateyamaria sp.]MBT7448472.1 fumarylacetoacetate hydrolase family protein [Tateyamaria sp.]
MRFLVGQVNEGTAVFLLSGNSAINLTEQDPSIGSDLMGIIGAGMTLSDLESRVVGAKSVPLDTIKPALPVVSPGMIMCLGLNYVDHIKEGGYDIPEYPVFFMRGPKSLMPAGAPMIRPVCSEQLDYEAELMVIIGKGGKHISESDALNHVFGYTIFNDGSVREYQRKTHQWTAGKNFDSTGAVGPIVVTPDELPVGGEGLKIEARVGDEILQSASTSDMMWSVARTIVAISEFATLSEGDLVAMGTPPGVGHAKNPPRWLTNGETVEVEIEGIGICSNPIVDEVTFNKSG